MFQEQLHLFAQTDQTRGFQHFIFPLFSVLNILFYKLCVDSFKMVLQFAGFHAVSIKYFTTKNASTLFNLFVNNDGKSL
jgi:hypothetical protein